MTKQVPRKLFDPKQASEFLQTPVGTMSNWRIRNCGPAFYKVGHGVRYDEEDLLRWLERNRVVPDGAEAEE
jgi:hypothetical protein